MRLIFTQIFFNFFAFIYRKMFSIEGWFPATRKHNEINFVSRFMLGTDAEMFEIEILCDISERGYTIFSRLN